MTAYVLLSGFDKNGFFDTVSKNLKNIITDTKNLLFIASNPEVFDKTDNYSQRIFNFFKDIEIDFESYTVLDKRMSDDEQKKSFSKTSCIFLMGGETLTQYEYLKQQNLIEYLLDYNGVIIGLSAGAINMAERSVIANPNYSPVRIYNGIGLADITVIPHFHEITADYIKEEILPLTYDSTIYGLYDDAIISVNNRTKKHSGTIYKLKQGNMKLLSDSEDI